mmetsp:Transcript_21127/g.64354  ORF Transcript_21127/g.64354 Transcript_21127/m.64354 type:complete len:168 (-) Transcript_21127:262-765(-)
MGYTVIDAGLDSANPKETYAHTSAPNLSTYEGLGTGWTRAQAQELVWRAANQSAFGEALDLLRDFGLVRDELGTGVRARRCVFKLDMDAVSLQAEAELAVSVAAGKLSPDGSDRLELATLTLTLSFAPPILLSEPQRPRGELRFEVKDARPNMLFDDALRSAAEVQA